MAGDPYTRFKHLTFQGFRELASDPALTPYEKIGFPDSYRAGKEDRIFEDIWTKLPNLTGTGDTVIDIGPGCTDVPRMMIDLCAERNHSLVLIDAPEMLSLLPDAPHVRKQPGRFPCDCAQLIEEYAGRAGAIVIYSVFHYVFAEGNIIRFVDECMRLLRDGGQMLIGDIPNVSKRKRFFASATGIRFHQEFMRTKEAPPVTFNHPEPGEIDDSVVLSVIMRARAAGCDAYVLPQPGTLPMANRREDILISKP